MDIGPLLKWKDDGVERPAWSKVSDELPSFQALWVEWDSLRVKNGLLKRAWENRDGKHTTMPLVVPATRIKEVLLEIHNGGSGTHFEINKKTSKAGARNVQPVRRSTDRGLQREGRCNNTTLVRRLKELQWT